MKSEKRIKKSKFSDHNIKVKFSKSNKTIRISFSIKELNKEKLVLSQDKKHYLLSICSKLKHPDFPTDLFVELDLRIPRENIDKEQVKFEEVVKRAFIEGDMFRTIFSQNYDGRIRGVFYGGGF